MVWIFSFRINKNTFAVISIMPSKVLRYVEQLIYPEGTTRLPVMLTTLLFLLMTLNAMTTTALYSFLPKMVKSFGASEISAGQYAGMIASAIYVGRLFFSSFWGYITDNRGKKTALIASGSCLILTTAAFAFSSNFYWATVTRFLQGCSMGLVIIVRVWLADVCDSTNMSLGMAMIITAYSVGLIIGPCIGGFSAFPSEQFPTVFPQNGFFAHYGIFLPVMIIDLALTFTVIVAVLYLQSDYNAIKEAQKKTQEETDPLLYFDDKAQDLIWSSLDNTDNKSTIADSYKHFKSYSEGSDISSKCMRGEYQFIGDDDEEISNSYTSCIERIKRTKIYAVLSNKACIFSSLLYCWLSLNDIGFAEIFPLLVATDPSLYGMGLTTKDIGSILMIVAISVTILQVTLSPRITKHFGSKKSLMYSNLVLIFLYPILGSLSAIRCKTTLWTCLVLYRILVNVATFTSIVCVNILVNKSVRIDLLGSAYGVSMTFASIGRMIAPVLFGSLFSWSLTNVKGVSGNTHALGFPFNHYFVLFVHSLFSLCTVVFASQLPDDIVDGMV